MRLKQLLTKIKSTTNIILKINDLDIITFRGTPFNIQCSDAFIKRRGKYEDTHVTNIDIVKEESETYILIESATGIGMYSKTEWVR
jgi:hypothetical protein